MCAATSMAWPGPSNIIMRRTINNEDMEDSLFFLVEEAREFA